jgi:hypothetical protein
MIILTPDSGLKAVNVMPRSLDFVSFFITDDSTNVTQQFDIVNISDYDWYVQLEIDFDVDLVENRYYDLVLKNDGDQIVFKDRIFVTSQDIETFSVNNNPDNTSKYKSNTSSNEYLTYGQ